MSEHERTNGSICTSNIEKTASSDESKHALYALAAGFSLTGLLLALCNATEQLTPEIDWMDLVNPGDGLPWLVFACLVAVALASRHYRVGQQRGTKRCAEFVGASHSGDAVARSRRC